MKPDVAYAKATDNSGSRAHSKIRDILILAKVRVNALVVATTAGGYYMGARESIDLGVLALAAIGTALVASGAAAINQVTERDLDRLMVRTRTRPLADGRMTVAEGAWISGALAAAGLLILWLTTNAVATIVAFATLVSYAAVYTPLKRRTSLSTVVGAVPGALPPMIGWAAAANSVAGVAPWSLFLIMFFWQLPHFLAIAWIYREDYGRAGMPMLPVVDKLGAVTGRQSALWAASLVPFSQLPYLLGMSNAVYAVSALALGIAQFALAVAFARHRSEANARRLFVASIIYLPLLWILLAIGKQWH